MSGKYICGEKRRQDKEGNLQFRAPLRAVILATLLPASFPVKHLSERLSDPEENQDQAVQPSPARQTARHSPGEEASTPLPATTLL